MIYLAVYMFLGLAMAVTGMVVWKDTPFPRRLLVVSSLWMFWPLMVAAVIHEKWMLRHVSAKCAWCDAVVKDAYPVGNEAWIQHALTCPKHPLRPEIERNRAALQEIKDYPVLAAWSANHMQKIAARALLENKEG